jgi:hypothetical protein
VCLCVCPLRANMPPPSSLVTPQGRLLPRTDGEAQQARGAADHEHRGCELAALLVSSLDVTKQRSLTLGGVVVVVVVRADKSKGRARGSRKHSLPRSKPPNTHTHAKLTARLPSLLAPSPHSPLTTKLPSPRVPSATPPRSSCTSPSSKKKKWVHCARGWVCDVGVGGGYTQAVEK